MARKACQNIEKTNKTFESIREPQVRKELRAHNSRPKNTDSEPTFNKYFLPTFVISQIVTECLQN